MADYELREAPYRYALDRTWDDSLPAVCFLGFSPEPTDGNPTDPLTLKAYSLAMANGFGGFLLMNEWAFEAPLPRDVVHEACREGGDALGPMNDVYLQTLAAGCHSIVACWGSEGVSEPFVERHRQVMAMFANRLKCFGRHDATHPRSVRYLRGNETLVPFA